MCTTSILFHLYSWNLEVFPSLRNIIIIIISSKAPSVNLEKTETIDDDDEEI